MKTVIKLRVKYFSAQNSLLGFFSHMRVVQHLELYIYLASQYLIRKSEVRGRPCNPSYLEDGVLGWLEAGKPWGSLV